MPGWARAFDRSECIADHAIGVASKAAGNVLVNGRSPLFMSSRGLYGACCGKSAVSWVVSEGSRTVLVNGELAAGLGGATTHASGKGSLIDASPDVLIGGPMITMEELAREDALALLAKGEEAIVRWNSADRQLFKEWFGTDSEEVRQMMLERTRDLRDQIPYVKFDQEDDSGWAQTYPWSDTIHLRRKFWTSNRTGPDSRAGTVIHEASHHWASGGTGDLRYQPGPSKKLARDLPPLAQVNADNIEYYFENVK
jgi:uncharacterized Zn-binding protein involved in type VI secretion